MLALLVACALGGLAPEVAPSQPAVAPARETTTVVLLVPSTADRRVADIVASVRSNLTVDDAALVELGVEPTASLAARVAAAREAATLHDARGVFWFDLQDPAEYRVYLWVPAKGELLRRRVPEAAQSIEAAIESMWIIVRAGTLALARGGNLAMEAVDPEAIEPVAATVVTPATPATNAPVRPPTRPRAPRWWLSIAYHGVGLARAMPLQSGGGVQASYLVHPLVGLGVSYGVVGGMAVHDPALAILRHEIAAVLAVGGPVHERVRLEGRLLPALELMQWRADDDHESGVQPTAKLAAELALRVHLLPRLTLDLAPGADLGFGGFAFVQCATGSTLCDGASRRVALSPWRVRPRLRAGLSVGF